jgi:gliding motility-associated-like protein
MYILNRNGELIFSTTDIRIGWDGTLHGSFLPSDVYVYMIKYVDRNGDHQQRRGQILLIP